MMSKVTEIVYLNRNNTVSILVTLDGEPVDFTSATGFELIIDDLVITDGIEGDALGVITFDIGDKPIPLGFHNTRLVVFDVDHTDGQVICDENTHSQLRFVAK